MAQNSHKNEYLKLKNSIQDKVQLEKEQAQKSFSLSEWWYGVKEQAKDDILENTLLRKNFEKNFGKIGDDKEKRKEYEEKKKQEDEKKSDEKVVLGGKDLNFSKPENSNKVPSSIKTTKTESTTTFLGSAIVGLFGTSEEKKALNNPSEKTIITITPEKTSLTTKIYQYCTGTTPKDGWIDGKGNEFVNEKITPIVSKGEVAVGGWYFGNLINAYTKVKFASKIECVFNVAKDPNVSKEASRTGVSSGLGFFTGLFVGKSDNIIEKTVEEVNKAGVNALEDATTGTAGLTNVAIKEVNQKTGSKIPTIPTLNKVKLVQNCADLGIDTVNKKGRDCIVQ